MRRSEEIEELIEEDSVAYDLSGRWYENACIAVYGRAVGHLLDPKQPMVGTTTKSRLCNGW